MVDRNYYWLLRSLIIAPGKIYLKDFTYSFAYVKSFAGWIPVIFLPPDISCQTLLRIGFAVDFITSYSIEGDPWWRIFSNIFTSIWSWRWALRAGFLEIFTSYQLLFPPGGGPSGPVTDGGNLLLFTLQIYFREGPLRSGFTSTIGPGRGALTEGFTKNQLVKLTRLLLGWAPAEGPPDGNL